MGLIAGVALVAVIGVATVMSDGDDRSREAQLACHDFVERQLRAPSTAGFEDRDEARVVQSDGEWTVRGHVDSENGFGARLRTAYTCTVSPDGGDWTLVDMDIASD